jgi:hypothetical protein
MDFPSVIDEKIYIIETNLKRRHLTDYQKVEMAKPLEDLIAEKARLRQVEAGKTYGSGRNSFSSNEENLQLRSISETLEKAFDKLLPIDTAKEIAKAIGVSKGTYERAKKVRDEGIPEEQTKAREKPRAITAPTRAC